MKKLWYSLSIVVFSRIWFSISSSANTSGFYILAYIKGQPNSTKTICYENTYKITMMFFNDQMNHITEKWLNKKQYWNGPGSFNSMIEIQSIIHITNYATFIYLAASSCFLMTRESKVRIGKSIYFDNIAPLYNYFNCINYIHQWFSLLSRTTTHHLRTGLIAQSV